MKISLFKDSVSTISRRFGALLPWLLFFCEPPAPAAEIRWLNTPDGERCGVVIECDLASEQGQWSLLGSGAGQPPLRKLHDFLADGPQIDLAVNGGYWNEYRHPVGVCAGPEGIYDVQSHPTGFALSKSRAYIGPLSPDIRLQSLSTRAIPLADSLLRLNQYPLPQKSPCLIDPRTFPHAIEPEIALGVVTFEATEPLRFNRSYTLKVTGARAAPGGSPVDLPADGSLLLLLPSDELTGQIPALPAAGDRYMLRLQLAPFQDEIVLATCGSPMLIENGEVRSSLDRRRTWRTAVGIDPTGGRFWIVALARGLDGLPGASLDDTSRILLELGVYNGINLDGGSSTAFHSREFGNRTRVLFPFSTSVHHVIAYRER